MSIFQSTQHAGYLANFVQIFSAYLAIFGRARKHEIFCGAHSFVWKAFSPHAIMP
jgi:hypothetical protein